MGTWPLKADAEFAMGQPTLPPGKLSEQHFKGSSSDDRRGVVSQKVRCHLAMGTQTGFSGEMSRLLRSRLRLAVLIILVAFCLHFLRILFQIGPHFDHRTPYLWFAGCEIALMAIGLGLLWSHLYLSKGSLRTVELVVFGSIAAFFAWLQVDTFHDGALLRAIAPGNEPTVFRLAGVTADLRWFVLIVLYSAFIPNTWRRCAAVVGFMALLPILLMTAGAQFDKATAPYVLAGMPDTVILMSTAVAIAVFGSRKIRELHEKAHQAQEIGQYRCKELLGFGGMGAVYLAEHVLLRRPCAIKVIRPDQAGDPKTLLRFEREVRAAATLPHWNTIEIFDYGHTDDGTFYYVMEYLPGKNLEDLVEQHGPVPPERAVHLLRQVCQALREAHGIGLIHRDIKPANIIACERGKIYDVAKLLDFGLVKSFGTEPDNLHLTRDGVFAGSPAFMSPEQAQGLPEIDARSDIYNVGAVAYFLITGKLIFDRPSALQMLHAHGYEPFVPGQEFTERVPADLQHVIERCLEKDPERRYPSAQALEKALAACELTQPWSSEKAEEWWRQHQAGTVRPPSLEERQRGHQTVLIEA
jgi:eukaryotic-like serine/threonine-protein kinase